MKSINHFWLTCKHSQKSFKNYWRNVSIPLNSTIKSYATESATAEEIVSHEKIQLTKPSVKKWKRPPFLKNFFIGKFDTELLAFPEILDKEQLTELEGTVKNINNGIMQKVDSVQIDKTYHIPDNILQDVKEVGLFGRMIPTKYGGLDLTYTACTRLNEILGLDWSLFSMLAVHESLATEAILKFGTEEQKSHYLPQLASGHLIGAFCCHEQNSGNDVMSMSTTADEMIDGSFIINGTKSWVTNADRAGVFIVFAKTQSHADPELDEITAFIIDENCEGIKIEKKSKTCLHGLDTGVVHFESVKVPRSNIIKGIGEGLQIYFQLIASFRIAQNSFTFGTLKALLDSITQRIIDIERYGESLADRQLIRRKLSKIHSTIYGMESLSYFTAAILDSTENPEVELEAAALKLFNSRGTLYCIREMMDLVGSSSFMQDMQLERYYRDAQGLNMFDASNDIVKLFLSFSGLKACGQKKADDIIKLRNSYFFPKRTLKEFYRKWKVSQNRFSYPQDIAGHAHPSLVGACNRFEEKLQVLELCVENVLETHGGKVMLTQLDPRLLAEAAVDLYAISAVISRCSRSYCIGLKNSHHELTLGNAFCFDADDRITYNLSAILMGADVNNEANHLNLGTQIVDCRGYFPEHPLKHNF